MTAPARVLYVAGWGRSGSTLLDVTLGSMAGLVSTGELRYLWTRGLGERRRCGCGDLVPDCAHWRSVLARVGGYPDARGALSPGAVTADQRKVVRTRHTLRLLREGHDRVADRLRHLHRRLYAAILEVTGERVVVDSSKMPADAALLATTPGIELHLVHLVRDPRAVAWSWQRQKLMTDLAAPRPIAPHSPMRSSAQWTSWNALIGRVARRAASHTEVRYEDLVAEPTRVLRRITSAAGLDPQVVDDVVDEAGFRIAVSHTVAGNPARFTTGQVEVTVDDAWRSDQPAGQRALATLPALPLLSRYGYPLVPSAPVRRGGA